MLIPWRSLFSHFSTQETCLPCSFFVLYLHLVYWGNFVEAPGVSSRPDKKYKQTSADLLFEEKLLAVKRYNLVVFSL